MHIHIYTYVYIYINIFIHILYMQGYQGLRTFGPQLIHHTQLKVRSDTALKGFAIVDTPGMIDSPMLRYIPPTFVWL
jgi:hypothetical protein